MSDPRDKLIERLEEENDVLRERIAMLETMLSGPEDILPIEVAMALSNSERLVLGALLQRERVSKDQIMATLYRNSGKDEAEPKIVDVFICKIRKKLKPFGVDIETLWGTGYFIGVDGKKKLRGEGSAVSAA